MNKKLTEIAYVLDRSGSVQPMVEFSKTGNYSTSASFSRKVKIHRNVMQECASPEEIKDLDADLSQIVQEETEKLSK
jgi:hypothetical protein